MNDADRRAVDEGIDAALQDVAALERAIAGSGYSANKAGLEVRLRVAEERLALLRTVRGESPASLSSVG